MLSVDLGRVFELDASGSQDRPSSPADHFVNVAIGFPFSIFGAMVNGFQRYSSTTRSPSPPASRWRRSTWPSSSAVTGCSLVAATTAVRVGSFFFYRRTAYRAFPLLRVRWSHVRWARLKEVTQFSVFVLRWTFPGGSTLGRMW